MEFRTRNFIIKLQIKSIKRYSPKNGERSLLHCQVDEENAWLTEVADCSEWEDAVVAVEEEVVAL